MDRRLKPDVGSFPTFGPGGSGGPLRFRGQDGARVGNGRARSAGALVYGTYLDVCLPRRMCGVRGVEAVPTR